MTSSRTAARPGSLTPARLGRLLAPAAVVVTAAAALAACTPGTAGRGTAAAAAAAGAGSASATAPAAATVTVSPAADAADVNPLAPVTVTAGRGMMGQVSVTDPNGAAVTGTMSGDGMTWTSNAPLAYGTTYTVAATASNSAGRQTAVTQRFSTVKPGNLTLPYIDTASGYGIQDGTTYGVGQALDIHWDEAIGDRAAAQKAVTVTTDPPQTAAFSWTDDQNMMWRTKDYLQPGTKVTVTANVFGVQVGEGLWGQKNVSSSFVVGDSHVAVADDATKTVTVYDNGQVVRTMPTSMGQGGYITSSSGNRISLYTNSGPHIVIEKAATVHMTSNSFGLPKTDPLGYDTVVQYGVKISEDGEYTHAAPWNHDLGVSDESHGCLNLSTSDAQWMYDFSQPGDIVDVRGTPQELARWNSGSWTVSWPDWIAGSALPVG